MSEYVRNAPDIFRRALQFSRVGKQRFRPEAVCWIHDFGFDCDRVGFIRFNVTGFKHFQYARIEITSKAVEQLNGYKRRGELKYRVSGEEVNIWLEEAGRKGG